MKRIYLWIDDDIMLFIPYVIDYVKSYGSVWDEMFFSKKLKKIILSWYLGQIQNEMGSN